MCTRRKKVAGVATVDRPHRYGSGSVLNIVQGREPVTQQGEISPAKRKLGGETRLPLVTKAMQWVPKSGILGR
jgi:hypothetical protein